MSDPGERLCFQPTTLFSFFGVLLDQNRRAFPLTVPGGRRRVFDVRHQAWNLRLHPQRNKNMVQHDISRFVATSSLCL